MTNNGTLGGRTEIKCKTFGVWTVVMRVSVRYWDYEIQLQIVGLWTAGQNRVKIHYLSLYNLITL